MWPLPPGGSWLGGRGRRGVTAAWPINSWPHQPGSHEGLGPDGSPDSWPLVWGRWESGPGGCVHRARGICASCRLQGPLGSARSPPAHPRALNSSGARGGVSADPPPPTPAFLIYVPPREGGVFFKNRTMWENNKAQNRTVTGGAAGRLVSAEGSRFSLAVLRNTNTRWLPRAHGGSHARAAHGAGLPGPRPHPSPGGNPQSRRQLQLCLPVPWA